MDTTTYGATHDHAKFSMPELGELRKKNQRMHADMLLNRDDALVLTASQRASI